MRETRRLAALLATASLAFPAGALAQGAGDNQYEDPFAGQDGSGQGSRGGAAGGGGGGGGGQGGNGQMGALSDAAPGQAVAAESADSRELARTGADPAVVALLGSGMLLAGAGLRLRVRRPVD